MVAPVELIDISTASTAWGNIEYLIFDETVTGKTYYKGWHLGFNPPNWWHDTSIYVDHATNTWYDGDTGTASTHTPVILSQTTTEVVLGDLNPTSERFKFTKPASTVWTANGTSTEGQASQVEGAFGLDANGDLSAIIPASSPSGNYWIVEGTTPRVGFTHTVLTATFQLATGWSTGNTSIWYLQDGVGHVLDTYRRKKKVFSNFW